MLILSSFRKRIWTLTFCHCSKRSTKSQMRAVASVKTTTFITQIIRACPNNKEWLVFLLKNMVSIMRGRSLFWAFLTSLSIKTAQRSPERDPFLSQWTMTLISIRLCPRRSLSLSLRPNLQLGNKRTKSMIRWAATKPLKRKRSLHRWVKLSNKRY